MKKIFFLLILSGIVVNSFSQLRYYAEAGINQSRPAFLGGLKTGGYNYTANTGFIGSVGIIKKTKSSVQLNGKLSFLRKSYNESSWVEPDYFGTNDYKVSAFQFHFLAEKNISQKRELQFFPSLGIYTTMHLAGTLDYELYNFGNTQKGKRDIVLNGNHSDFNRWDFGLAFGLKTQWKKYFIQFIADAGMIRPDLPAYNRWGSVQFTAGYFLK
ncbi:MAG: hypothetical protein IPH18_06325 [Chitinophagaceae bacterium]|nr:hypothetical protein [Chitinophagaceae bacterium]MBK8951205.1 hypothetical protein [Chitinophagaceae bacterium]